MDNEHCAHQRPQPADDQSAHEQAWSTDLMRSTNKGTTAMEGSTLGCFQPGIDAKSKRESLERCTHHSFSKKACNDSRHLACRYTLNRFLAMDRSSMPRTNSLSTIKHGEQRVSHNQHWLVKDRTGAALHHLTSIPSPGPFRMA